MSTDKLLEIYVRSRFLHERMEETWAGIDAEAAERRLAAWREVIAKGDRKRFERRLLWDGWTEQDLAPYLGGRPAGPQAALPEWTEILQETIGAAREGILPDLAGEPIPFQEGLFPLISVALRRLETSSQPAAWLSNDAYQSLQRSLLLRLSKISLAVLEQEFSHFRPAGLGFLGLVAGEAENPERVHYDRFIESISGDGLTELFLKYPVWARSIASTTQFWIDRNREFLNRLARDFPQRRIAQLLPDLSDPHWQGRTVMCVRFDTGERLVYKPKDVGSEAAFNGFLEWYNRNGAPLPFRTLSIIEREHYGWAEFVEHQPCRGDEDIERYYRRAGMLLCALYVLEATDCFRSNLIASGEYPVLVDAETLMHERLPDQVDDPYFNSVLAVGLLPAWQAGGNDLAAYDISGFGYPEAQNSPAKQLRVTMPNTDTMTFSHEQGRLPVGSNVPRLNDRPISAADHLGDIIEGFESMYRFFMAHRDELLHPEGPLSRFKTNKVRFLLRSTSVYTLLIQHSFKPEFMRDGADCSIQLDALSRAFTAGEAKPSAWTFLREETRSLAQMDVPWFSTEPAWSAVMERLRNLSDADRRRQSGLISEAFYCQKIAVQPGHGEAGDTDRASDFDVVREADFLAEARKIAELLQRCSFDGGRNGKGWIGPFLTPVGNRFRLATVKEDVYSGRSGIALFLAALSSATGDEQYRASALAALAGIRSRRSPSPGIGIGGLAGLGSIVYALTRVGVFVEEPELLDLALEYSRRIDSDLIAADRKLDIVSGAAGAILALLALHSERRDARVLETAVRCGAHLAEGWQVSAPSMLNGFSHGAAGMAYSLRRLSEITGEVHFNNVARDLRETVRKEKPFMVSWCHGAPGIALGGLTGSVPDSRLHEALETTAAFPTGGVDHLCCGNLGRCDILLSAGLRKTAEEQARWVLMRKEKAGNYRLIAHSAQQVFVPGFFRGVAGIGYAFLRLSQPGLPSVLALD